MAIRFRAPLPRGGPALPLNFARATTETAWAIPEPPPPPKQMPANADPSFVVATIKPSNPNAVGQGYGFPRRGRGYFQHSLSWLITMGYSMHANQVIGAPAWFDSERFDLLGRPDTPGQPSRDQLKIMFKKLLAERFQLKFHMEKGTPGLHDHGAQDGAEVRSELGRSQYRPGVGFGLAPGGGMTFNVRNAPFGSIANALQGNLLDRPGVDLTGLTGRYDFSVKFTPDPSQMAKVGPIPPGANAPDPDAPPDIYAAFQQQLGLKLESTKTAVDVTVIEKIEKPSTTDRFAQRSLSQGRKVRASPAVFFFFFFFFAVPDQLRREKWPRPASHLGAPQTMCAVGGFQANADVFANRTRRRNAPRARRSVHRSAVDFANQTQLASANFTGLGAPGMQWLDLASPGSTHERVSSSRLFRSTRN